MDEASPEPVEGSDKPVIARRPKADAAIFNKIVNWKRPQLAVFCVLYSVLKFRI